MLVSLLAAALFATASPTAAATPIPSRTFVGEIVSIDVPNRQVVVVQGLKARGRSGPEKRETVTVHVPFTTRVVRGKKAASLTDLRPRDHAVVRYQLTAGGAEALSLQVADLAAPTPAPPADAPTPGAGRS